MGSATRRYVFQPLERRGVLIGLDVTQLATLLGAFLAAVVVAQVVPRAAAAPAGLMVFVAGAAGALMSKEGRPLVEWVPIAAGWLGRRAGGRVTSPLPLYGSSRAPITASRRVPPDRLAPRGIELAESPAEPGRPAVGLIRDRRHSAWAAVLPVQGRPFSLLDEAEQVQRLEAWRAVLGALARPGSPLRRVQWVERSGPAPVTSAPGSSAPVTSAPACPPVPDGDDVAASAQRSYGELVAASPAAVTHEVWLVLSVGSASGPRRPRGTVEALQRELRLLDGSLRSADLQPGPPLDRNYLGQVLGRPHRAGSDVRSPWPLGAQEPWSCWHADGSWHTTYWISEWPRLEVPPDFLTPLLLGLGRRTVSVIMAPVPASRALREVRSARTADVADAEIRSRAGFLSSARRDKEAEGTVQREQELAEGHCEYRFSGYVTVTADDRDALQVACAETEHAAQSAHLELRCLYGRQAEAFTWTLPLARGLL